VTGPGNAAAPLTPPASALRRAEQRAADAVGALLVLWGFKRQMGRVWTVLFLSDRPLTAAEACDRLGISTGLLSMTLADLRAWGVVRSLSVPGDRKARWVAETDVWRLVRHVLASRERRALEAALASFESALEGARRALAGADPAARGAARVRAERLARLAGLTRSALAILQALLRGARADLGPLRSPSGALAAGRRAGGA
jgi:DNA-binding transcriptional regulator GbsR (MarR family)